MEKLTEILKDLEQGKISADNAESKILRLFNVIKSVCRMCEKERDTNMGLCIDCTLDMKPIP